MKALIIIIYSLLTVTASAQQQTIKSDGFNGTVEKVTETWRYTFGDASKPYTGYYITETWYNRAGEAEKALHHLFDSIATSVVHELHYSYKSGRISKVLEYWIEDNDTTIRGHETYLYDTKGRLTEETDYSIEWVPPYGTIAPDTTIERTVKSYDKKNREILCYVYKGVGAANLQKSEMCVTSYSSGGRKRRIYGYNFANDLPVGLSYNIIQEDRKEITTYSSYNANDSLESKRVNMRMKDGRMHTIEHWSKTYGLSKYQYTFGEFDKQNNCLQVICTHGTSTDTYTYEIEYYE